MRSVFLVVVLAVVATGGVVVVYKVKASSNSSPRYRTVAVERGDLLSTITATGTIEPEEVVNVGAQVAGRIWDFGIDQEAEKARLAGKTQAAVSPAELPEEEFDPLLSDAPLDQTTETSPTAAPAESETRSPNAVGPVAGDKRVRIDYGSIVHVDTELAYIDKTKYQAQVEQAQAALNRSIADLGQLEAKATQAAAELRRAQQLRQVQQTRDPQMDVPMVAISGSDYDLAVANDLVAKANLVVGKAMIEQSRASLRQSQTDLDYTTIKSPVEGVIVDRRVNIGQTVVAALNAPSIFLIAKDLSRLQVWASVNEADIGRIRKGMEVDFNVDAFPGQKFVGKVKQIRLNAQMTSNVVTYTVVVETDNPDGKLLPYLTASLRFHVEEYRDVLYVPNAALQWTPTTLAQVHPDYRQAASSSFGKGPAGPGEKGPSGKDSDSKDLDSKESAGKGAIPAPKSTGAQKPDKPSKAEDRGRVWILEDGFVRPLDVAVGPSDGTSTAISGPEIKEDLMVVTNEETAQAAADETTNPFGPPKFGKMRGR
jgi:HlyD family secretion protein